MCLSCVGTACNLGLEDYLGAGQSCLSMSVCKMRAALHLYSFHNSVCFIMGEKCVYRILNCQAQNQSGKDWCLGNIFSLTLCFFSLVGQRRFTDLKKVLRKEILGAGRGWCCGHGFVWLFARGKLDAALKPLAFSPFPHCYSWSRNG